MIKPNTCPYCDGPYTLTKPCDCTGARALHVAIAGAAAGDPGEDNESLVTKRYTTED